MHEDKLRFVCSFFSLNRVQLRNERFGLTDRKPGIREEEGVEDVRKDDVIAGAEVVNVREEVALGAVDLPRPLVAFT